MVSVGSEGLRYRLFKGNGVLFKHQGKVRDTYRLVDHPGLLLQVTTDRASIFDFVLGSLFPGKGRYLTMLTVFWLTEVLPNLCENHLVAYGSDIDRYVRPELRHDADLHSRALIVRDLSGSMLPIECIARGFLTGSGLKDYRRTGMVSGHELPLDLHDGSRLPRSIFTPSTKAESGHDQNIDYRGVREQYGPWVEELTLALYDAAVEHALTRGLIIADTKFEFDTHGTLADEVLTSDSSRTWLLEDYQAAQEEHKSPQGFDKQFVREWGTTVETPFFNDEGEQLIGINSLDPKDAAHAQYVRGLPVLPAIIQKTMQLYGQGFCRLTGSSLDGFLESRCS